MNGYSREADFFKALAHPIRLQILEVLQAEGEACVCHLEARLGQRQAYISQQLSKLREAGFVVDRREGLNVFYAATDESIPAFLELAKRLTVHLALIDGIDLAFPAIRELPPQGCSCPKCAHVAAATVSQDSVRVG